MIFNKSRRYKTETRQINLTQDINFPFLTQKLLIKTVDYKKKIDNICKKGFNYTNHATADGKLLKFPLKIFTF